MDAQGKTICLPTLRGGGGGAGYNFHNRSHVVLNEIVSISLYSCIALITVQIFPLRLI